MKNNLPITLLATACALACGAVTASATVLLGPVLNATNGHSYYLLDKSTWSAAEAEAISLGGHLAKIDDATENQWVETTFGTFGSVNRHLWIGLNDFAQFGTYVWSNGDALSYTNWFLSNPDFTGSQAMPVYMISAATPTIVGQWNNYPDQATSTAPLAGDIFGVVEVVPGLPQIIYYNNFEKLVAGANVPTFVATGVVDNSTFGDAGVKGTQGFGAIGSIDSLFKKRFLLQNSATAPGSEINFSFANVPAHNAVSVSMLLAAIDTWDGHVPSSGADDKIEVLVDGALVLTMPVRNFDGAGSYVAQQGSFGNLIAPPLKNLWKQNPADPKQKTAKYNDSAFNLDYEPLLKDIPHTASTLTITVRGAGTFAGTTNKNSPDEAYALDNVKVIVHK